MAETPVGSSRLRRDRLKSEHRHQPLEQLSEQYESEAIPTGAATVLASGDRC